MMTRFLSLAFAATIALSSTACAQAGDETATPVKETTEVKVAVMNTSQGSIVIRLYPEAAPKAVENLERLAEKGYYDGLIFHRVIDGFMIQGGDPTGTGYGGKSIWGVPFEDEFSPELRFDRPFLLAMANSGPKTNGSQFFVTLAPTPHLNDKHTIYGEVIEGMDVVRAIGKTEVDPSDKPTVEVSIKTITFETREIEG
jgi:cyclophilin family peptidyl-prolyl cis-trans isomerase